MTNIKIFGEWKNQGASFVKVDNVWRSISRSFVKIDGVWRDSTFGSPPAKPIMQYVSTGVFQISNYNSALTYETIFKIGSGGTATLNTSNGRYTLNGTWSGFDVISRYALGAPASAPGYMERKPYSFSCRIVPQTCSQACNCRAVCNGFCSTDPCGGYGQCGCQAPAIWFCGTVDVVCDQCPYDCSYEVCDVLINEPGYTNSGTEWYKAS
jgi:hypothetical protein